MDENANEVFESEFDSFSSHRLKISSSPFLEVITKIFDRFNRILFNGALNSVVIELYSQPMSNMAITGWAKTLTTMNTCIFFNTLLVKDLPKLRLMEVVVYEMIYIYVQLIQRKNNDENDDIIQVYIQRAINYVNNEFGLKLHMNFDFYSRKTHSSPQSWVDCDQDDIQICEAEISILEIDDEDVTDVESYAKTLGITTLFTKRIILKPINDSIPPNCDCCRNYQVDYAREFRGTAFTSIAEHGSLMKCPLCDKQIQRQHLFKHLKKECA